MEFLSRAGCLYQMELVGRLLLSGLLGYLIGHERMSREKSAGMRTHSIVALGACLFMVVSKYGFGDVPDYDASRVAAQIVSGIGFLGAGVIFVKNNSVSGLTTAAGLWTTAGVGMAIGAGLYFIGISAGILVVITQIALHKINFLATEPVRGRLKLETVLGEDTVGSLENTLAQYKVKILGVKVNKGADRVKIEFNVIYPPRFEKQELIAKLAADPKITAVSG